MSQHLRRRGAALLGLLLVAPLVGCSGPVELPTPEIDDDERTACESFEDALPDRLNDQERRETEPSDALGAAYGDPAITVSCGGELPEDFTEASSCEVASDVGWYLPPDQIDDLGDQQPASDATLTAVEFRPVVRLVVPADYRPDGMAAALAELARPVTDHLQRIGTCD